MFFKLFLKYYVSLLGLVFVTFFFSVGCQIVGNEEVEFPNIVSVHRTEIAEGEAGQEFAWLPGQQLIAYINEEDSLIISKLDGSDAQVVFEAETSSRLSGPHWSSDGAKLSFSWTGEGAACRETVAFFSKLQVRYLQKRICLKLYTYHLESGLFDSFPGIVGGLWSSNGEYLAGAGLSSGFSQLEVVRQASGENIFRSEKRSYIHVEVPYTWPIQGYAWAPDSHHIVYAVDDVDAKDQGRIANIVDGKEIVLENANSEHYIWSPDSQELAYFRVEENKQEQTDEPIIGDLNVYIYSLSSGKERKLTQIDILRNSYSWPAWSPDGRYIALLTSSPNIYIDEETGFSSNYQDLVLIDTASGKHHRYEVLELQQMPEWLKWSLDSQSVFINQDSEIVEIILSFE